MGALLHDMNMSDQTEQAHTFCNSASEGEEVCSSQIISLDRDFASVIMR